MKKLFTLLFCSVFSLVAFAQQFTFDHDSLTMNPVPVQFESILDNHITNTSGSLLEMRWTRISNVLKPTTMGTAICIRDLCYPQTTSTNTFTLERDEKAILSCHLFNTVNAANPYSEVQVKIELVSDPSIFKIATFTFGAMSTNTDQATAAKARFFPNPAMDFFQISNADWVKNVKVMNILGKTVENYAAKPDQEYKVSHLPTGCYFAILQDESGKAMRTIRFNKI